MHKVLWGIHNILWIPDLGNFDYFNIQNSRLWIHIETKAGMEPQKTFYETCSSWFQQTIGATLKSDGSIFMDPGSIIYQ